MELELVLSFVLTVIVVWYALHPFFEADAIVYERQEELRPNIAQEDLEEDYRTGKLSEPDYLRLKKV